MNGKECGANQEPDLCNMCWACSRVYPLMRQVLGTEGGAVTSGQDMDASLLLDLSTACTSSGQMLIMQDCSSTPVGTVDGTRARQAGAACVVCLVGRKQFFLSIKEKEPHTQPEMYAEVIPISFFYLPTTHHPPWPKANVSCFGLLL